MWLFTTFGFFSIVKLPDDDLLTVRALTEQDMDALRLRIPILSPAAKDDEADYPYRARLSPAALAVGLAVIAGEIDYEIFRAEVGRKQSMNRAFLYQELRNRLMSLRNLDGRETHEGRLMRREDVGLEDDGSEEDGGEPTR